MHALPPDCSRACLIGGGRSPTFGCNIAIRLPASVCQQVSEVIENAGVQKFGVFLRLFMGSDFLTLSSSFAINSREGQAPAFGRIRTQRIE